MSGVNICTSEAVKKAQFCFLCLTTQATKVYQGSFGMEWSGAGSDV